jgi:hypothetical protein
MNNRQAFCLALALAAGSAPAWAQVDAAALLRCRALADNAARLACYDALTPAAPLAATAAPAASPARAPAPAAAEGFGLPSEAEKTQSVASQINGKFEGWEGNVDITLANGQVWRITDGSRAHVNLTNPKVVVERGAFTAFYLRIEDVNQSPRVRRVK